MKIDAKPIKYWRKSFLLIISGIVCVIVMAIILLSFVPGILTRVSKDIAPIDDSDLQLQKIVLPETDNAYYDLIKLDEVIYYPIDETDIIKDISDGKTWDDKVVEELLSRNARAFEYFSAAANKPKYQDPAFSDPSGITMNTTTPPAETWLKMARLSAMRAMYLAREGNSEEAFEEAIYSVRIGQKIQDSQAPTLEYLVAILMKQVGIETAHKFIASLDLNILESKQYIQEFNKFYNNDKSLVNAFKGEYLFQTLFIDSVVGRDVNIPIKTKNSYYFQPNKTKSLFAEYARTNINNVNKLCIQVKPVEVQTLTPSSKLKRLITENLFGKMLHDMVRPVYVKNLYNSKCEEDFLVGSTQILLALKAYKNDTGTLPESLNQLIPQYIQSIPIDPFDGKPIRYSSTDKIIYSVGSDSIDSGGSTGDDCEKMPDPTFNIGF